MRWVVLALLSLVGCTAKLAKPSPGAPTATPVPLPDGAGGIGFDDLGFARELRKVVAPAGRTGNLDLLDPDTRAVTAISGFAKSSGSGGHGNGTTSADEGAGLLFAIDRDTQQLDVVDPAQMMIVADAPLAGGPDYVRFVATTHEVWVTEPSSKQIEVFALPAQGTPKPSSVGTIKLDDGPESLVIDATRKRAYTHEWGGKSHAIDVTSRKVVATWDNGCSGSRGIALDEKKGFLFVGCEEGKAVVLDVDRDGKVLGSLSPGVTGVDIIAYSASLGHLYLPGEGSGTMAVLVVSSSGALTTLAVATAGTGSHCAAADDRGNVWVCDPEHGQLLLYHDGFPASQ
jgi:DNA-binding beta-propeller fold protein YncE